MEEPNDDLLKDFVKSNDYKSNTTNLPENVEYIGNNIKQKVDKIEADSNWLNIPLSDIPHGVFYKDGIKISIRPVNTKEIQSFAVVNEKNPYDVMVKMNELLSTCVKIENVLNNDILTYTDLYDGDRDTLVILIAKASAKSGKKIEKKILCACGLDVLIEMVPSNYVYKTHHEKLIKYFDTVTKKYNFTLKSGAKVELAPPTLGLVQDINNYMLVKATKSQGKETPNVTFMQTLPYIKAGLGVKSLTFEQLTQEEYNFTKMNKELFMFIYDTIDMISFGIEDCKSTCTCGREVHTHFGFPDGARSLFFVSNPFDELIG
jgi:hypothetical protein